MDRCNPFIIIEFELGFIDKALTISFFQFKIVARGYMVMLIRIDAFQHMILLETKLD